MIVIQSVSRNDVFEKKAYKPEKLIGDILVDIECHLKKTHLNETQYCVVYCTYFQL